MYDEIILQLIRGSEREFLRKEDFEMFISVSQPQVKHDLH